MGPEGRRPVSLTGDYCEPAVHQDIVLRHLRSFTGKVLLFAFPDSDAYDAGTAETTYSTEIQLFNEDGEQLQRLTAV